jgi:hypothetical protein
MLKGLTESSEYREREEKEKRFLEMIEADKLALHEDPRRFTDRQLMERIDGLWNVHNTIPFDDDYSAFIAPLSFSLRSFEGADLQILKRVWGDFLNDTVGCWEDPCDLGMAEWYVDHDRPMHALAVFEHLYAQARCDELNLGDQERDLGLVLTRLFDLCIECGITGRARYVAELIRDYHEDGLIDLSAYAEVFSKASGLRYRELGELVDEEREKARDRLRGEHGHLLDSLHAVTQKLVVDAELWSVPRLMSLEPTAAPRHWTLAIETEFHYRVVEPRKPLMKPVLEELFHKCLKDNHSCSPGEILHLIRKSRSNPLIKAVLPNMYERWVRGREQSEEALGIVVEHRKRLVHAGAGGVYGPEDCAQFLHTVHASGWVFQFLQAVQPR